MFNLEYRDCGLWCSFLFVVFVIFAFLTDDIHRTTGCAVFIDCAGDGGHGVRAQVLNKEHKTSAAEAKTRELWCYHCNTMDSGERCEKLMDNKSDHHLKCKDEKMCMVKSISLTTNTGNSTSQPKLWLLERNCTKQCEPGCIVIGERTKLYACTKCCEADFCNAGRSAATYNTIRLSVQTIIILLSILFARMVH